MDAWRRKLPGWLRQEMILGPFTCGIALVPSCVTVRRPGVKTLAYARCVDCRAYTSKFRLTFSQSLSDLIKALSAAAPLDTGLLTVPPAPLMELICTALQRSVNSTWLALLSKLTASLTAATRDPDSPFKRDPGGEARAVVLRIFPAVIGIVLPWFGGVEGMRNVRLVVSVFEC